MQRRDARGFGQTIFLMCKMSQNAVGFNEEAAGNVERSRGLPAPLALRPVSPDDICAKKRGCMDDFLKSLSAERPVLIAGPTASGKSGLANEIVARQGGVVVNADALQVYDCWRLLTARPPLADEAALPHQLYGHIRRDQAYSVGHWLRDVAAVLAKGPRPVIVGGTGLYFSALTEGLAVIPPVPGAVRAIADARMRDEGPAALLAELDAATAARIDRANPARIQRAWEVLHSTGRGLAQWQAETPPPLLLLANASPIVLRPTAAWLAARIDQRFDQMMAAGALEEARAALPGWDASLASSRAIGAPELIAHLRGEITLPEVVTRAKLATRQYAKRQRTWFRNRMKSWSERIPG